MTLRQAWILVKEGFYLEYVARWWFLLVGGLLLGLIFGLVTDFDPFPGATKSFPVFQKETGFETYTVPSPRWKVYIILAVGGLVTSLGLVWVLEEFRPKRRGLK